MADEDGEDDGSDEGAPPIDPRVRVWEDPTGTEPIRPEERAHFGIPDRPKMAGPTYHPPVESFDRPGSPEKSILAALVDKFPSFNPEWPGPTQDAWFAAFSKLMEAGLK